MAKQDEYHLAPKPLGAQQKRQTLARFRRWQREIEAKRRAAEIETPTHPAPERLAGLRTPDDAARHLQEAAVAYKLASDYPFQDHGPDAPRWRRGWADRLLSAGTALLRTGISAHIFNQPTELPPEGYHAGRILFAAMQPDATAEQIEELITPALASGLSPGTLGIAMEKLPQLVTWLASRNAARMDQRSWDEIKTKLENLKVQIAALSNKPATEGQDGVTVWGKWKVCPGEAFFDGRLLAGLRKRHRSILAALVRAKGRTVILATLKSCLGEIATDPVNAVRTYTSEIRKVVRTAVPALPCNPIEDVDGQGYSLTIS
jgi:hypothetical protein